MAHTVSGRKRVRQTIKKQARNTAYKSTMKTMVKKYLQAIESKNKDEATVQLNSLTAFIAKVSGKGVIHRKKASRKISRLTRKLNEI